MANTRALAAKTLAQVFTEGHAFDSQKLPAQLSDSDSRNIGFYKELCFGSIRQYFFLHAVVQHHIKKPLGKKDADINALLIVGAYQLIFLRTPNHAALSATVEACKTLKKHWAKGLVNGVLRNILKLLDNNLDEAQRLDSQACIDACGKQLKLSTAAQSAHPDWLYQKLATLYPDQATDIVKHNNSAPPMTLRVTDSKDLPTLIEQLASNNIQAQANPLTPHALTLDNATDTHNLPGFEKGQISVQDAGAQLAVSLFDFSRLSGGANVLDACAAPGGKALQLIQTQPNIQLTALDISEKRLQRVAANLQRGVSQKKTPQQKITLKAADASNLSSWWDQQLFQAILLDAPCSGSGVINRHPDIKVLRRASDIKQFAKQQQQLLEALWPTLEKNGELVYCTCSIFPEENQHIIQTFINASPNAQLEPIQTTWGIDTGSGRQLLPNIGQNDGFFFAKIRKV